MFGKWKRKRREREYFNHCLDTLVRVKAYDDDKNLYPAGSMTLREAIEKECIVEITVDRRIPF